MGAVIHCRERRGRLVYRVWHTASDSYLTGPVDEATARRVMRDIAMRRHEYETGHAMERARQHGSSGYPMEGAGLRDPWERNREQNVRMEGDRGRGER
jgi:hypothetical protein